MALYKTVKAGTPSSKRSLNHAFPFHGSIQNSMNHLHGKQRLDSGASIYSDISRQTTITSDWDQEDDDETIIHRNFLKPTTTPSMDKLYGDGNEKYFSFNDDKYGNSLRVDDDNSDSEELDMHYTPQSNNYTPASNNDMLQTSSSNKKSTSCYSLDDALKTLQFGKYHYILIIIISTIYFVMGIQSKISKTLQALIDNNHFVFDIPTDAEQLLYIAFGCGNIIGIYLCVLADKFGRKRMISIACIFMVPFTILQIISSTFTMLVFARLFIGCCCGVIMISCHVLLIEYVPNPTRFRVMYFLFTIAIISYAFGSLISYIVYAASKSNIAGQYIDLKHWKILMVILSIPVWLLPFLNYAYLPDSPHFIALKGNTEMVMEMLKIIDSWNGDQSFFKVC